MIVDFWAPWCGPCKQLGPMLEKAVLAPTRRGPLVKINIDENPELAPADAHPVDPRRLCLHRRPPGRRLRGRAAGKPGEALRRPAGRRAAASRSPIDEALALAKASLEAGDPARAAHIYAQVLQHEPGNAPALAGLARYRRRRQGITPRRASIWSACPPRARAMPTSWRRVPRSSWPRVGRRREGALGRVARAPGARTPTITRRGSSSRGALRRGRARSGDRPSCWRS